MPGATWLDAYALIALLVDEPAAEQVQPLIAAGDARLLSPNLAEVIFKLGRRRDGAADQVREAIELAQSTAGLSLLPATVEHGWRAGDLGLRHHHRSERAVSLADCFLAAAVQSGDRLATSDPALLDLASAEGLSFIALPDSRGHVHSP